MAVRDRSVTLGYVHAGVVRAEFMRAVLTVISEIPDLRLWGTMDASAGTSIPKARNLLVEKFLASPAEWLWMVDTDVVFTPGALPALAAAAGPERPVITGIVYVLRPDGSRVASVYELEEDPLRFPPLSVRPEVFRVGACGAACLLIHRDVFAKIAAADGPCWFDPARVPAGLVGEDLSFCRRIRAAGFPIHAAGTVTCGHLKTSMVGTPGP